MSTVRATYPLSSKTRLEIAEGDLTQEPVDAVVNAANSHLAHGGGVAAAIVHKGGRSIQQESDNWVRQHGLVTHEEPAYTHAGSLPARYVIHAVGPVGSEESGDAKLASAITGSLRRAEELGLQSIAFPAISTGIFGFPKERAARIFFETFQRYFGEKKNSGIVLVRVTLWGKDMVDVFLKEGQRVMSNG